METFLKVCSMTLCMLVFFVWDMVEFSGPACPLPPEVMCYESYMEKCRKAKDMPVRSIFAAQLSLVSPVLTLYPLLVHALDVNGLSHAFTVILHHRSPLLVCPTTCSSMVSAWKEPRRSPLPIPLPQGES